MKSVSMFRPIVILLLITATLLYPVVASAELSNKNVFDTVLQKYEQASKSWSSIIIEHASRLFWTLVLISMVWTFGMMALRKADLGEFFAEFVRFTVFTGFFWWLLTNGPNFANSIVQSLRQIGGEATGLGKDLNISSIVDMGFNIFFKALDNTSFWSPVDSFIGVILSGIILVVLALIGVNMLVLLCSAWILMYGGVFFLGFGGSQWTSDIAINYYKTVLGVAASLLAMTLLIGIGASFLDAFYAQMSTGIDFKEMSVMVIVVIILLYLVEKVPSLISAMTGAWVAGGIGHFGTGAALGAFGLATAAAATGGAALVAGATSMGGGAQALYAAYQKAQQNMGSGSGMFTGQSGMGPPGTEDQGGLARAMGTGVRFGADMGARLAKGAGAVMANSYKKAASETVGGKIARAIKEQGSSGGNQGQDGPSFSDDSLGAAHPEVQEFVNKKSYSGE
jgi:P-type conjugative transfer protein TrbL